MGWMWIGSRKDANGDPIPDPPAIAQAIAEINQEGAQDYGLDEKIEGGFSSLAKQRRS